MLHPNQRLGRRNAEGWEETRFYQEVKEEGRQEGLQEEGRSLVCRQLNRRFSELPESMQQTINTLSLEQVEALAEALLDFTSLTDLEAWLAQRE